MKKSLCFVYRKNYEILSIRANTPGKSWYVKQNGTYNCAFYFLPGTICTPVPIDIV